MDEPDETFTVTLSVPSHARWQPQRRLWQPNVDGMRVAVAGPYGHERVTAWQDGADAQRKNTAGGFVSSGRARAPDGALARLSQTTVHDTGGSATPAFRRRTAPSRWTCSAAGRGRRRRHVYHDFASGVRDDRPGLDSGVRALRTGDVLVVWKFDRLGRTLAHLVNTVQDLSTRGVGLRVLTGQGAQIDTTTAAGRLVFGIFSALAEFERELIRERTLAGLTAARARGRNGGRTFALSKAQVRLAQAAMAHRDISVSALCRELGIRPVTLSRYVGPQGQLREQGV